jgi:hypothetical protein
MLRATTEKTSPPFKMCTTHNLTVVSTTAYSAWGTPLFENNIVAAAMKSTNTVPDVVYFNGGLHYLHLIPHRQWDNNLNNNRGYYNWKNAEQLINNFVNKNKQYRLIYMTSHSICDEKYNGSYKKAIQAIQQDATTFAKRCAVWLQKAHDRLSNTMEDCTIGTFNRVGVQHLNSRILSSLGDDVGIVDAFALTDNKCNFTKDGRHYSESIVDAELAELLQIIKERIVF